MVSEAQEENSEEAVAEVVVVERHETYDTVSAYDTDTGEEVRESSSHSVEVVTPVNAEAENVEVAEASEEEEEKEEPEDKTEEETAACGDNDDKKKCAEDEESQQDYASMIAENLRVIAELKEAVENLRKELSEMKETPAHMVAETLAASVQAANPFVGDVQPEKKYTLLEPEDKVHNYTLI